MAMQEHSNTATITLSYDEVKRIFKQMRKQSYVNLTAKLYYISDESPEEHTEVYIYGDFPTLPDYSFEL